MDFPIYSLRSAEQSAGRRRPQQTAALSSSYGTPGIERVNRVFYLCPVDSECRPVVGILPAPVLLIGLTTGCYTAFSGGFMLHRLSLLLTADPIKIILRFPFASNSCQHIDNFARLRPYSDPFCPQRAAISS